MKKKMLIIIMILISSVFIAVGFSACNDTEENSNRPDTPNISVSGNVVYWNYVANAESYILYQDGEEFAKTWENFYSFDCMLQSSKITVVSVNCEGVKSKESNSVMVYRSTGFLDIEKLTINGEHKHGEQIVPAHIKYVEVTGKLNGHIKIANRSTNLIIELKNSSIIATQSSQPAISNFYASTSFENNNYVTIIKLVGDNVVRGADAIGSPSKPSAGSGQKGITGYSGGNGILLSKVVFVGKGTCHIYGGKGGRGGDGADTSTWSTVWPGDGGAGGKGGNGIICSEMIIALCDNGKINTIAGVGGNGGSFGVNGSILTGPWANLADLWDGALNKGDNGISGNGCLGNKIILSGALI